MTNYHYWMERVLSHAGPLRNLVDRIRESYHSTFVLESGERLRYRPWKGDKGAFEEVWEEKLYVTPQPGDIVLDVGAHIGAYSSFALKHAGEKGLVICIEPDPRNARLLRTNLERIKGSYRVHEVAVSDKPGTMELHHHALYSATTHTGPRLENDVDSFSVKVGTIDEICSPLTRLDVLKMDIEGAELKALKGGAATLRRFHPHIAMEYHRPEMGSPVEDVIHLLEDLGYRVERKGDIQGILRAEPRSGGATPA